MKRIVLPSRLAVFWPIIALNIILLVLTWLSTTLPETSGLWKITSYFNLAYELNIAVWIVAMFLLLNGLLAFEVFRSSPTSTRYAWLCLAVVFVLLSWDEMGSFHERIGDQGWAAYVPIAVGLGVPCAYAIITLLRSAETRRSALLIILGFGLLASVVFQEFLESQGLGLMIGNGLRTAIEEGSELFAILLFLIAVTPHLKRPADLLGPSSLVPTLRTFRGLLIPIAVGAGLHLALIPTTLSYTDVGQRGDPGVWYPSAMFFVLALWSAAAMLQRDRYAYRLLTLIALVGSVAAVYLLSEPLNARLIWLNPVAHGTLLCVFAFLYVRIYGFGPRRNGFLLLFLLALTWLNAIDNMEATRYVTLGGFALILTTTFFFRIPSGIPLVTETRVEANRSSPTSTVAG